MNRILIIGIGNEFHGDDAAGLIAARRLRGLVSSDVRIIEHTGDGQALLDLWADAEGAILLDAVRSGAPPGTIIEIDANHESVPHQYFGHSTHAFGLTQAIEMGKVLHCLPSRLQFYGIEAQSFEYGVGLSAPVEAAVTSLTQKLSNQY